VDRSVEPLDSALLRGLLQSAVDGILSIDTRGIVRSFNAAAERMFGYSADEVIGQNVSMLMPEPDRSSHDDYVSRYLDSHVARIIGVGREVRGRRKDGSIFPMMLGVSEVEAGDQHVFLGIVRDVSAAHQLEAQRTALIEDLARVNAELERFTYTVSHDLKSPLITIKGFLGSIERDARAGRFDRLSKDLGRIEKAADRMALLLDELLELSRVGRVANPSQHFDMTELADEIVGLLEGPAKAQQAEITVARELGRVFGDRVRIGEVLQNAVENALKFANPDQTVQIEIAASGHGSDRVFTIRDNGIGIDPQYLERVFRLFEQLDQRREGSGIGLALAKRIIEVHKGKIWAESDGLGHGTTLCFTIGSREGDE
jgi:PAS domain S-box-containing protein